ncbi:MAG: sulfotransferase family 2 domain-containing protein [Rhodobacteraceae bacterium]|nr:sulfotransferase family 2 domain-containing protein [Paracoccaceae bacterium]
MIISEKYNFIFVHIPKTAGLSVTDAFGKYGRPRGRTIWRSISRRMPYKESPSAAHFRVHEPASKMIAKLSRPVFDGFLSFSVVRNPFDHAVSHYEYMKQFRIKSTADKVGRMSFRDYLEYRMKPPIWNDTIFARMPDQSYYLTDAAGDLAVRRLVRFENLNAELEELSRDLKLPDFALRHVNKTKAGKKPMSSYYTDETADLVRKIYDRDFDLIGYSRDLPDFA